MQREEIRKTAAQCRHYAMCKIDFLGIGVCPSGQERRYVSHYPQGRMDLYVALAEGTIPITEALVEIVRTCTLCGICDKQCHFVTGMRPLQVMRALKNEVEERLIRGTEIFSVPEDEILGKLRAAVGREWATNDPAVLFTYANDPFPLAEMQMPGYVVLPGTAREVSAVVSLAKESGLPYAIRGNGGSVFGFVFSDGMVVDMNRMKNVVIDAENWSAEVEAGVTSFELQEKALQAGMRANVAEPAATVCGNIVCTGAFSPWANVYGTAADTFIDMEFVDRDGKTFRLNDRASPNLFAFRHDLLSPPGICTKATVKLNPLTDDEEGVLVPFSELGPAVAFARELSLRRIGLAVAVLGSHYVATFMSPTKELAEKAKKIFPEALGIRYAVSVIGDRFARDAIKKMSEAVIDNRLLRILMLGLPRLLEDECLDLIRNYEGDEPPYAVLSRAEMVPVWEAALASAPETIAAAVDEDLRDFYAQLYARPEMTDMVWLNMFRIVSSRMSRHKHMFAFLMYVPLDRPELIDVINHHFKAVGDRLGIENDYGFLTPLDLGKRGILEYDYYIDHTLTSDKRKIESAMLEIEPFLDDLGRAYKGMKWLKYVFAQGCSRKEHFLYI